MSGGFTDFLENKLLEHIFITDYLPGLLCIGLCTKDPTDTASGSACFEFANADNYARAEFAATDWELMGTPGYIRNKNPIDFSEPSASWGIASHFVILDETIYGTGNVLIYGRITPNVTIVAGSLPRFAPQMMTVALV